MKLSERKFQGWILDVARQFGWQAWHVPMPMRPIGGGRMVPETRAAGLPDLVLLHETPPRLILAEVKDSSGGVSQAQVEFLRLARMVARNVRRAVDGLETAEPGTTSRGCLVGVYVWRPGNEDLIEAILRGASDDAWGLV